MPNLHEFYDKLTADEKEFVDESMRRIFEFQKECRANPGMFAPPLAGDDRAERATDGIAKWVIGSRKL